ncbi:MAG: hypothetical protein ABJF01_03690 [bacterium]
MDANQTARESEGTSEKTPSTPPDQHRRRIGLDDPRALDILTTEHWSLLSSRTLGYQEMFGRTTIFIAVLSGTVVALALLAQATHFGYETLWFALLLIAVALFIGLATFVRSVAINFEDALWVTGMNLLRHGYLEMVPELEPFFVTGHAPRDDQQALAHGSRQRAPNLAMSLTTTSSVVAALNSVLAGSLASDIGALLGRGVTLDVTVGAVVSLVSAVLHVRYASRFRQAHAPLSRAHDQLGS